MVLTERDKQWFFTSEAKAQYNGLTSLEDRIGFIYSCLKHNIKKSSYSLDSKKLEEKLIFKTSILLADAIHNSNLEYKNYPDIIDATKNPFVAFVENGEFINDNKVMFAIYMSILHNIADAFNKEEWIYNKSNFKNNDYVEILEKRGKPFIGALYQTPEAFVCDEETGKIQLEIAWMFNITE